ITIDDVKNELRLADVVHGIDLNAAVEIIEGKQYNRKVCIARGSRPTDGLDGRIQFYFKPSSELAPKDKKYGEVDMKDLGMVTNILANTPIAKIEPPTNGSDGYDVFGKTLPARTGKEIKYSIGAGTMLVSEGTVVIAEFDGNLRWMKDHFVVEDTLVIGGDVGVATGNIEFIGNIVIKGEVKENFTVTSKKNITVGSFVSGATLVADGDINIGLGGVNSDITAKGNIKLNFCENSKISCQGDFTVQSCILSEVFCAGVMNVSAGKGAVVGGKYTALQGFNANILGSETYVKTSVTLGNGAVIAEEKLSLEERVDELESNLKKLLQIATILQEHKQKFGPLPAERESMLASAIRSRFTFQREINQIKLRIKEIDHELKQTADLSVVVRKQLFPGVTVRIGTEILQVRESYIRTAVRLAKSGSIECVPIN
ncbi:MAG: FapA family protein, partial [Eubacterium sp.]|nr:FapA family protein [Eubacterium sp.]